MSGIRIQWFSAFFVLKFKHFYVPDFQTKGVDSIPWERGGAGGIKIKQGLGIKFRHGVREGEGERIEANLVISPAGIFT